MAHLDDPGDRAAQRNAFFEGLTGRKGTKANGEPGWEQGRGLSDIARSTRSMLEYNFAGRSARHPVDTRTAAERLGVSQRTVQRWLRGDSQPRPEAMKKLTTRTRQTVTTKQGRSRLAAQMKESIGTENRTIKVTGRQGPTADPNATGTDRPRGGSSALSMTPEEQAGLYDAWANGGDSGATSYLERLYDQPGRYVANWHFHGIKGLEWK